MWSLEEIWIVQIRDWKGSSKVGDQVPYFLPQPAVGRSGGTSGLSKKISMQHRKHAKLRRPAYGTFSRNEWAILGTSSSQIEELAYALTERLSQKYKVAYVNAEHKSNREAAVQNSKTTAMNHGAALTYTDKGTFHRFDEKTSLGSFQFRQHCNRQDLVLVQGHHFPAKKQIVVLDPQGEAALSRQLDRLTDVALILSTASQAEIYPFLKEIEGIERVPMRSSEDIDGITTFLEEQLQASVPALYGLVLAGGKSQRMGTDKGAIDYHGKAQREYAADLLRSYCEETFISCRREQLDTLESHYPLLPDTFEGLGPFGAIVSAFREYPDQAWLVVACDLPLLDRESLGKLVESRHRSKIATAFNSPVNAFPEPLIAIWEPRSYPILLSFLAQGYSCPRKVLINSDIALIDAPRPEALMNVNRPEEVALAKEKIKK